MAKNPKRYLQFKAIAKYNENDDEWCCSSSIPEITGDPHSFLDTAIEDYERLLDNFLFEKYGISPDEIILAEKKTRCGDARFVDDDDYSVLKVDPVDLRISLTYRIIEKVNRELSEFDKIPDLLKTISERPDAQKILDMVTKINEISDTLGVTPITVFNQAMSELNRQKEGCETA